MRIKSISWPSLVMLTVVFLFTVNLIHAIYNENSWKSGSRHGKTFLEALGCTGLSLVSECTSARNPILEPICLPDIPAGYCYHRSCGLVGPTFIGKEYSVEVIHP